MDRRTVLAITLCFLIYLGWQKYYLEPRIPHNEAPTAQTTENQQTLQTANSSNQSLSAQNEAPSSAETNHQTVPKHPAQTVTLQTGTGDATLGDSSPFFVGWSLKNWHQGLSNETPNVDLKFAT